MTTLEDVWKEEDGKYTLTAHKVRAIVMYCLFHEDEMENGKPKEGIPFTEAVGIRVHFGLHTGRLEEKKPEIKKLLEELPKEFMAQSEAGGYSFTAACFDKNGRQWGEHQNMDELFTLGTAVGYVFCLLPRDMWHAFPQGLPYYSVNTEPKKKEENKDGPPAL